MNPSRVPAAAEHAGNNFDAIRIVAAFTVLFSHHHALTGQAEPRFLGLYTWGTTAVIVFFIISGYLVTASWYNDPSFVRFGARRILRIWPALALAAALTAYGLGAWVTSLPPGQYWTDGMTSGYLLNTLALRIRFALPGVFDGNPFPNSPNGSLWTIPFEVRCYAVLALAGLLGLMRNRRIWLLAVAAMMAWILYRNSAGLHAPTDYGREFSAFFLAGSALCVLRILRDRQPGLRATGYGLRATGVALCALAAWAAGWRYTAVLIALPPVVVFCGVQSTPVIRRFGRWGDLSYGVYLFAFPVQQTVVHFLWPRWGFAATLALAALATTALAYVSWHGIEKRALRLKPRKQPI